MLQFMTGKFYGDPELNPPVPVKSVCFSPNRILGKHEFAHVTFTDLESNSQHYRSYLLEYQHIRPKGMIVKSSDDAALKSIVSVFSVYFNTYFGTCPHTVEYIALNAKNSLPKYFSDFNRNELVKDFDLFFNLLIGLDKDVYDYIIKSMQFYHRAIELAAYNMTESFISFVYALEYLSSSHYRFNGVKAKLEKGYIDFVLAYTSDNFFCSKNRNHFCGRRSEFEFLIKDSYNIRSKFVHHLKPLPKEYYLKPNDEKDVISNLKSNLFIKSLTLSGIIKITREVMLNYVNSLQVSPPKTIDITPYETGVIQMQFAPQMWVHTPPTDVLNEKAELKRFFGIISLLSQIYFKKIVEIPNLEKVLTAYNSKIKDTRNIELKRIMACIAFIYCKLLKINMYAKYRNIYKRKEIIDDCSFVGIIAAIFHNIPNPSWTCEEIEKHVADYLGGKYKKHDNTLPLIVETHLYLWLAYLFKESDNEDAFKKWLYIAYYDNAEHNEIQEKILLLLDDKPFDINFLFNQQES